MGVGLDGRAGGERLRLAHDMGSCSMMAAIALVVTVAIYVCRWVWL